MLWIITLHWSANSKMDWWALDSPIHKGIITYNISSSNKDIILQTINSNSSFIINCKFQILTQLVRITLTTIVLMKSMLIIPLITTSIIIKEDLLLLIEIFRIIQLIKDINSFKSSTLIIHQMEGIHQITIAGIYHNLEDQWIDFNKNRHHLHSNKTTLQEYYKLISSFKMNPFRLVIIRRNSLAIWILQPMFNRLMHYNSLNLLEKY